MQPAPESMNEAISSGIVSDTETIAETTKNIMAKLNRLDAMAETTHRVHVALECTNRIDNTIRSIDEKIDHMNGMLDDLLRRVDTQRYLPNDDF